LIIISIFIWYFFYPINPIIGPVFPYYIFLSIPFIIISLCLTVFYMDQSAVIFGFIGDFITVVLLLFVWIIPLSGIATFHFTWEIYMMMCWFGLLNTHIGLNIYRKGKKQNKEEIELKKTTILSLIYINMILCAILISLTLGLIIDYFVAAPLLLISNIFSWQVKNKISAIMGIIGSVIYLFLSILCIAIYSRPSLFTNFTTFTGSYILLIMSIGLIVINLLIYFFKSDAK
ncbi:MAG: hypothetical protein ACFFAT_22105, partial [Promethearchaeota archaeon]